MYASFHIPSFPLSVLLRDDPETARGPAALVTSLADSPGGTSSSPQALPKSREKTAVLLSVNRPAARFRLAPGLTTTRALARCPQLALLTPDPALEKERQSQLREFAASLGPDFEETAPGTFLLDLLTLPHAHSAPLDWIEQALRKATPLRLPLHLALAPTPDLALLAARSSKLASRLTFNPDPELSIQPATAELISEDGYSVFSIQTIEDLPLSSLNTEHCILNTDTDLLHLWGIQTLGELAALPLQGLAERLGPEVARLHDILHGKHHRLLTLHRPPQHFRTAQELEHALETLEPLLFLLRRGLDTLCSRLASSQRAAISARLTLTFDDGDLHFRDLRLPEPTCDPATLLRLLHTHLDTVRAPAPVVAWSLALTSTLPGEAQHHLFERSLRDPNKFADTLARLEALLGPGRLGTPVPLDTFKPDSFRILEVEGQRSESQRSKVGEPGTRGPGPLPATKRSEDGTFDFKTFDGRRPSTTALPLRRFRPAIEINVASEQHGRHQHPLALLTGPHRGPVTAAHGPFPLSGHWWDPDDRWERVEWDLQLADRTLLRLAFQSSRPTEPHPSPPARKWFLEGIYA